MEKSQLSWRSAPFGFTHLQLSLQLFSLQLYLTYLKSLFLLHQWALQRDDSNHSDNNNASSLFLTVFSLIPVLLYVCPCDMKPLCVTSCLAALNFRSVCSNRYVNQYVCRHSFFWLKYIQCYTSCICQYSLAVNGEAGKTLNAYRDVRCHWRVGCFTAWCTFFFCTVVF